jgi:hypothetical protein
MDVTRLRQGERIAAISGVALILIMFIFDWFSVSVGPFVVSRNAWGSYGFTDIVMFITALAAIGIAYLSASRQQLNLPVAGSAIVAALGAISVILVLISLISPPDFGASSIGGVTVSKTREIGVFLGLIATAALTYGAYRAMQEEGTSFGAQADRLRGPRGGGPGSSPPPPPTSGP